MDEEIKYFTVTQYNQAIKNFLDSKEECRSIHLKGEISNFKGHTRGHLYFTLKDEESRISAVMFSSSASNLSFTPKDGDEVQAFQKRHRRVGALIKYALVEIEPGELAILHIGGL